MRTQTATRRTCVFLMLCCVLPQMVSTMVIPTSGTNNNNNSSTEVALWGGGLHREARGMDEHHHVEEEHGQPKSDVLNYYEFLINEGSYKFWAWFQLFTAALLIYSGFAAVYYSKYTYATQTADYDYDYFFKRSGELAPTTTTQRSTFLGLSAQTYQRILDAITSKKYS